MVEAPVEYLSVAVDADYSDVHTDYLLDSHLIYKTAESVTFTATLKYGASYTVKDLGTEVDRTLAVKGNVSMSNSKQRAALGVPADAKVRYSEKKDLTTFSWTERVVLDEPLEVIEPTVEDDDVDWGRGAYYYE